MTLAVVRGNFGSLAFPFAIAAVGFLMLTHTWNRFPSTDLERGLDRLFALLFPTGKAATTAARVAVARQVAGLRRGVRRWGKELEVIRADGYETAARISSDRELKREHDDRVLVAEALRVLRDERAHAGADLTLTGDPASVLAYGLGARPTGVDLTSLEDLLRDLGLSEEGDELRTHFDDVVASEPNSASLGLKDDTQRSMFRDLAGASFVLGASARILELALLPPSHEPLTPAVAAGSA
jgi:hypothetical protein